jgi:hypothetical protein
MANRPTGGAPGRQRQAQAQASAPIAQPQPQSQVRHSTARVAVTEPPRFELPGWFWGALGCLSVLVIGFAVLFVVTKPGAEQAAPAAFSAPVAAPPSAQAAAVRPAPARPAPGAPARGAGIHVEQIAAPPPPALAEMPRPKAKPPRAVKVAKTPAAGAKTAAAPAAGDEESDEEELLAPRSKRAAAARAPEEDESEEKSP